VPAQDGAGRDEPVHPQPRGQDPGRRGEDGPVGRHRVGGCWRPRAALSCWSQPLTEHRDVDSGRVVDGQLVVVGRDGLVAREAADPALGTGIVARILCWRGHPRIARQRMCAGVLGDARMASAGICRWPKPLSGRLVVLVSRKPGGLGSAEVSACPAHSSRLGGRHRNPASTAAVPRPD
jgi:hypothetical protein